MGKDEVRSPEELKRISGGTVTQKPNEVYAVGLKISFAVGILVYVAVVVFTVTSSPPKSFYLSSPTTVRGPMSTSSTNASHILFCIGGSSATWPTRKKYSSLWWNPNVTRGFVWLDEKPTVRLPKGQGPPYRVSSRDWTRFKSSSSGSTVRIARIISESFKLRLPGVRWFVMGDDDTVFFVENLVSVLSRYDHREMWYIGDNSESVEQDLIHSYSLGFGGGGYAISYSLAEKLVGILDGCIENYFRLYASEERVRACLAEIGVPLTQQRGFHQFDIRGSPYGLLAAHPSAPLISVHHLDYLDPLFPNRSQIESLKTFIESYNADPPRFVQQTICYARKRTWSFSISWGYTVQLYPSLVAPIELLSPLQTFKTWRSQTDGPFTVKTRPVPSSDPCHGPIIYMLDGVRTVGNNTLQTSYLTSGPIQRQPCLDPKFKGLMSVKRITVSSEKSRPEFWLKAPRRQCCDFVDSGTVKNNTLQIYVRQCRSSEVLAG